ncbi:MAG: polyprenyl synthetase family protein, partial [Chloroflexi bacterium]|nr:polyprenyl synthetase family protein [Chloroflexota bacterium]
MSLKQYFEAMLPEIEKELQRQVARLNAANIRPFHDMLSYHMGWTGEGAGKEAAGKRIRPVSVLLTAAASGGDWVSALPAAAAVELIHNFSLVHDDVQDNSPKRRGRPTVWKKWGVPMAINVGDALFVIAFQALTDLSASYPAETALRAAS